MTQALPLSLAHSLPLSSLSLFLPSLFSVCYCFCYFFECLNIQDRINAHDAELDDIDIKLGQIMSFAEEITKVGGLKKV